MKQLKFNKRFIKKAEEDHLLKERLSPQLSKKIAMIKEFLGNSSDLNFRDIELRDKEKTKIAIAYLDVLADEMSIQENILKPLMIDFKMKRGDDVTITPEVLKEHHIPGGDVKVLKTYKELIDQLLNGDTLILLEGYSEALSVQEKKFKERGVEEPTSQTVVRGPKDGFTETLNTNLALIRNRLKDPNLRIETFVIGKRTKTDVAIVYLKDLASTKVLEDLREKLNRITVDGILEGGNIEELIVEHRFSLFPLVYNTERPDIVTGNLLEGRIALIVSGTPFVLVFPVVFSQFFQATEDYYNNYLISSFLRLLRFGTFFIAMLAPSLYLAITLFHQEMLPTTLLLNVAAQREGVPFPPFFESLTMELTFEILREAGVRMPRAVGGAISIVGALVIGEAAVQAGIVSPFVVIIVSLTAISSFVFPAYNMMNASRVLRFLFMVLGATFGLYGVVMGFIGLVLHLSSLRSFGIPYLYPFGPFDPKAQKDTLLRLPFSQMFKRPKILVPEDQQVKMVERKRR